MLKAKLILQHGTAELSLISPFSYLRDQSVNTATDIVLILIFMNFLSSLIINKSV